MAWPTPQDYNEAIQNPRQNCADPELAGGTPTLTPLGLPRPITGNFASVYRIQAAARDWAVRCFWREYQDMPARYAAISTHLQRAALPYTVGFDYLERGIRIRGAWYPLLKMEWVEGELLHSYLATHLRDTGTLNDLAEQWLQMATALETAGIAHGDLQHGNVLVVHGQIKLVDYDGMFVPSLAGRGSHELGHQHYQHPRRDAGLFAPWMDRCSVWVIYLSIRALALCPELWTKLGAGEEHLLFRREDLEQPRSSLALEALRALPDEQVRRLATTFGDALSRTPAAMPSLVAAARSPQPAQAIGGANRVLRPFRYAGTAAVDTVLDVEPGPSSRPAWLADHVAAAPAHTFAGPRETPRLTLLGTVICLVVLVFVAGTGLLAALPAVLLCLATVVVATGVVGFCFRADPVVTDRRAIDLRRREADRALKVLDEAIDACRREMDRRCRALEAERERTEQRKSRLLSREQREREQARDERDQVASRVGKQLDELDRQERAEVNRLLEELRTKHVRTYLQARSLRAASLPDIPALTKLRLWTAGVRSAVDVSQERMEAIARLGNGVARSLSAWRVDLELEARRSAPTTLPAPLLSRLAGTYGRQRAQLAAEQTQAEERERSLADAIGRRYREKHLPLDRGLAEETVACAEAVTELEGRILSLGAERRLPAANLARIQRELEPYADINPTKYLLALIALE